LRGAALTSGDGSIGNELTMLEIPQVIPIGPEPPGLRWPEFIVVETEPSRVERPQGISTELGRKDVTEPFMVKTVTIADVCFCRPAQGDAQGQGCRNCQTYQSPIHGRLLAALAQRAN
jgi:hypothetical protein